MHDTPDPCCTTDKPSPAPTRILDEGGGPSPPSSPPLERGGLPPLAPSYQVSIAPASPPPRRRCVLLKFGTGPAMVMCHLDHNIGCVLVGFFLPSDFCSYIISQFPQFRRLTTDIYIYFPYFYFTLQGWTPRGWSARRAGFSSSSMSGARPLPILWPSHCHRDQPYTPRISWDCMGGGAGHGPFNPQPFDTINALHTINLDGTPNPTTK